MGEDSNLRVRPQVKIEVEVEAEARGRFTGNANENADDEGRALNLMEVGELNDGFIQVQPRRKRRKAGESQRVEGNRSKSAASEENKSKVEELPNAVSLSGGDGRENCFHAFVAPGKEVPPPLPTLDLKSALNVCQTPLEQILAMNPEMAGQKELLDKLSQLLHGMAQAPVVPIAVRPAPPTVMVSQSCSKKC